MLHSRAILRASLHCSQIVTRMTSTEARDPKVAWLSPEEKASMSHVAEDAASGTQELVTCKRVGGRFQTPWPDPKASGFMNFLFKLNFGAGPPGKQELDKTLPVLKPDFDLLNTTLESGIRVTWIGHATVLIQMESLTVITDPIFSQRCAMVQWMGPKRYRDPPCTVDQLPKIDAVLISHTHYDHVDYNSIKALNRRFGADLAWFVPLGHEGWMKDVGCEQVYASDWWQEKTIPRSPNVKFVFTPAKHGSNRSLSDMNKSLWGSWCVLGERNRFFFGGDTAHCDVFKQIGNKYGPFDLAAIPIGAYEPREIMWRFHIDPAEAVQIHHDLRSKKSLGIHWGTFKLTTEFYLEPRDKLDEVRQEKGMEPDEFFTMSHGESRHISDS